MRRPTVSITSAYGGTLVDGTMAWRIPSGRFQLLVRTLGHRPLSRSFDVRAQPVASEFTVELESQD